MDGRSYRGMSAEERLLERRERLISAAFAFLEKGDFFEMKLETLCAAARISNRAFYECFDSREELFLSVFNRCLDAAALAVKNSLIESEGREKERILIAATAYCNFIGDDLRRGRIMHVLTRQVGAFVRSTPGRIKNPLISIFEEVAVQVGGNAGRNSHFLLVALAGALEELVIEFCESGYPANLIQSIVLDAFGAILNGEVSSYLCEPT